MNAFVRQVMTWCTWRWHFGNPAQQTANAQQNQQAQAEQYAQNQQQIAQGNLQQYMQQNPNPFLGASIQRPPQQGGGMTTGLQSNGGMMPTLQQFMGGGQKPSMPPGLPGQAGGATFGGNPPRQNLPPGVHPPMMPPGGRPMQPPGMQQMPIQGGGQQIPPGLLQALNLQGQPQMQAPLGGAQQSPNFRKGSYGNTL